MGVSLPTSVAVTFTVPSAYRSTMRNKLKFFGVLVALLGVPSVAYAATTACDCCDDADCHCPCCD